MNSGNGVGTTPDTYSWYDSRYRLYVGPQSGFEFPREKKMIARQVLAILEFYNLGNVPMLIVLSAQSDIHHALSLYQHLPLLTTDLSTPDGQHHVLASHPR